MINLNKLKSMKKKGEAVAWITAYDYPLAHAAEQAGIDMILVGDSGGMCQLGHKTTGPTTMDEMIMMAKSVRRGAPNTFIIGDMPQGSYEASNEGAVNNALRFIKEAECNAVKLEGGARVCDRVKAINDAGVLVMGHLGLTPQSADSFGGYRVQGKTIKSLSRIIEDAIVLQQSGAFAILLEAMPTTPGKIVADLSIPIYGIGAGQGVDGQLIIMHDLLGLYPNFRPKFAKCYIPEVIDNFIKKYRDEPEKIELLLDDGLKGLAVMAIEQYIFDVKNGLFPGEEYSYPLDEATQDKLLAAYKEWRKAGTWIIDTP